jgi:hypothetical protein
MEEVAEHLALHWGQVANARDFALVVLDRFLDLVAKGGFALFAEQECPEATPETSLILR